MRSVLVCLLATVALGWVEASQATIVDEGQVEVDGGGNVAIGRDAFGRRTVDGSDDVGHPMATIAEEANVAGELLVRNGGVFETLERLAVGKAGSALADVASGGQLRTGSTRIMDTVQEDPFAPATSVVRVSGSGSEWTNAGLLELGVRGREYATRVEVVDGGHASTTGAEGWGRFVSSITVDGAGSKWTNHGLLGLFEDASLVVRNGAEASDVNAIIGNQYYRTQILVQDTGSLWRSGDLRLSSWQDGLYVESGGRIESRNVALGTETYQNAFVRGAGSSWSISGALAVSSFDGSSRLNVQDGGLLQTNSASIGDLAAGLATLSVSGAGSQFENAGLLSLRGSRSVGALVEIAAEAHALTRHLELLCDGPDIPSFYGCKLDVLGGALLSVTERASATGNGVAGTLWRIADGGQVEVGEAAQISEGAELFLGNGTITTPELGLDHGLLRGSGTVRGDVVNGGTIAPGASFGTLLIEGDLTLEAGGVFSVELGGLEAGADHDVLTVLGTSMLGGTLRVAIEEGFLPGLGDVFEILTSELVSGRFTTLEGLHLAPGRALHVEYLPASVRLVTVPEPGAHAMVALGFALTGWLGRRGSRHTSLGG